MPRRYAARNDGVWGDGLPQPFTRLRNDGGGRTDCRAPNGGLACRLGRCFCFAEVSTGHPHRNDEEWKNGAALFQLSPLSAVMPSAISANTSPQLLVCSEVFSEKTITVYSGFSAGKKPQNQPSQISVPF